MGLCLVAGAVSASLAVQTFTLAWIHSIEKVRWEEDWRIEAGQLHLVEARVRGTGAGMEPPPAAVLRDGAWRYRPDLEPLAFVNLMHSPFAQGYDVCFAGSCRPLAEYLPGIEETTPIVLKGCL